MLPALHGVDAPAPNEAKKYIKDIRYAMQSHHWKQASVDRKYFMKKIIFGSS